MDTKEMEFAQKEHEGGQHKLAEFPDICYDCYKQKKWKDSLQDSDLVAHYTGEDK